MAFKYRYWSCSPLADRLRGTKKPYGATAQEWDTWHTLAKMRNPLRFWLAEEALGTCQSIVSWPGRTYSAIKHYVDNRWVTGTHQLTANAAHIKPGDWCDVGYRFLPCLFNELVDFVEIDLASRHVAWSDASTYKEYHWYGSWNRLRCPQAGLANLEWQSGLTHDQDTSEPGMPTMQAVNAKEILALYTWWTRVYPLRQNAYDASGWTAISKKHALDSGTVLAFTSPIDPLLKKEYYDALNRGVEIEAEYDQENEDMLIRLIKIRNSLWS